MKNDYVTIPNSPDVPCLEIEINNFVYKLYDLTDKETLVIEGKSG